MILSDAKASLSPNCRKRKERSFTMKRIKKLAALALAVMMLMSLTVTAYAADGDTDTYEVVINNEPASMGTSIGDILASKLQAVPEVSEDAE